MKSKKKAKPKVKPLKSWCLVKDGRVVRSGGSDYPEVWATKKAAVESRDCDEKPPTGTIVRRCLITVID